jgi:hypothetical protein
VSARFFKIQTAFLSATHRKFRLCGFLYYLVRPYSILQKALRAIIPGILAPRSLRFYRNRLDQTDALLVQIAMQIIRLGQDVVSNQKLQVGTDGPAYFVATTYKQGLHVKRSCFTAFNDLDLCGRK